MGWEAIVGLLIKFGPAGFDLVQKLIEKWSSGKPPTAADIEELRVLAAKTPRLQMEEALSRAGVKLDSPEGKALLALV